MEIKLTKMPFLSLNYDTVIDFENEYSRERYFNNIYHVTHETNIKVGSALTSVTVNKSLDELKEFDYLYLKYEGKYYYYFIIDFEMKNFNNTVIHVEKDVFTTHQFDVKYNDSFVDRCHVNRWDGDIPTRNTVEEGLDFGELILLEEEKIKDFSNSIIMASSVPMGILPKSDPQPPSIGGNGNPLQGQISKNGFIFLKQEEAFAPYPFDVEGNGMDTAGYGVHSHYQSEHFRKLQPFPTTEKIASEVLDSMISRNFAPQVRDLIQDKGIDLTTLSSNKFDVWVSIAMNYGLTGLQRRSSWKHFITNPNDTEKIADLIASEPANSNRRKREARIYREGKYPSEQEKPIGKYNANGSLVGTVDFPGYIPAKYQGQATDSLQLKVVQSARKLLGKPYRWGGNYPPLGNSDGTDCSGLCQWAYNDIGKGNVVPGRWTTETMINYGKSVTKDNIQIGDCIFTSGHVRMYTGVKNGKHRIIEAPRKGLNVREIDFDFPTNLLGIRRYL